jgi:hypothetical protein
MRSSEILVYHYTIVYKKNVIDVLVSKVNGFRIATRSKFGGLDFFLMKIIFINYNGSNM